MEKQNIIKTELEYERRLVRCVSSIAAWTSRSIAKSQNNSNIMKNDIDLNHRDYKLNIFNELFSLVPTASKILTKPRLNDNVHLYVFEEEDRFNTLWTYDRTNLSFHYLKYNEMDGNLRNKLENGEPIFINKKSQMRTVLFHHLY